jgi:chaperone LolA
MRLFLLSLTTALVLWGQAPPDTPTILKGVEKRYNAVSTLQATFTQIFRDRGRAHPAQTGTLYLSKPERTRWEYSGADAGDFFLSDGKFTYEYKNATNSVERQPLKQTEDQRIPLSFLLGRLDFQKDFEKFEAKVDGADTVIALVPRNKNLIFKDIVIAVASDSAIRRVTVNMQEGSSMDYALAGEQRNIKLSDSLFKFAAPPDAQVLDVR